MKGLCIELTDLSNETIQQTGLSKFVGMAVADMVADTVVAFDSSE
jgi:hypothetical protein